jgi:hypothetical protein
MKRTDIFVNGRLVATLPMDNQPPVVVNWLKRAHEEDSCLMAGPPPFQSLADVDEVVIRTSESTESQLPALDTSPDGSIGSRHAEPLRRIGFDAFINEKAVHTCRVTAAVETNSALAFFTCAVPKTRDALIHFAIRSGGEQTFERLLNVGDTVRIRLVAEPTQDSRQVHAVLGA